MTVDRDAWTCPHPLCGQTVRGTSTTRRAAQRAHIRQHGTPPPEAPGSPAGARAARPLRVPPAPKNPRRTR